MSPVNDSPVNSSLLDDDFASFLDEMLDSPSSPQEDDVETVRVKRHKLENSEPSHSSVQQAYEDRTRSVSTTIDDCLHPGSFENMCILCGMKTTEEESSVTLRYIHKGLRLKNNEIVRLRTTDMKNLRRNKKLYLVLDLDHTLLNSTQLVDLRAEEEYLKNQTSSQDVPGGSIFMVESMHMMTKLRPFLRNFLNEAHNLFELYIYTMGDRLYALAMAKLLDPKGEYFGNRIISREDGTSRHQKALDVVLGQESAVMILDDTETAWPKHKENLIVMERYHFFGSSCRQFNLTCKSLSELKSDESETEGALTTVLEVLKRAHSIFFDESGGDPIDKDVRQVLKALRNEVLKGCKIVFSHVFRINYPAEDHHLWRLAEQLGAVCAKETDSTVTHVVSLEAGTDKSRWAVKQGKFLVHPRWIEASHFMWKKLPEENFPITEMKRQ